MIMRLLTAFVYHTFVETISHMILTRLSMPALCMAVLTLASCSKTPLPTPAPVPGTPAMSYLNLNDLQIAYARPGKAVDVNQDRSNDLYFGVELVGDPIAKVDKRQFVVISGFNTSLPVTADEQVMPLSKEEPIPVGNFNNANWYNASAIVLTERLETIDGSISWRGAWLTASKKYLPIQLLKNNERYNGWVELSFDQANQHMILHQVAISQQPEAAVKAGL
jgi:hypothetical protein